MACAFPIKKKKKTENFLILQIQVGHIYTQKQLLSFASSRAPLSSKVRIKKQVVNSQSEALHGDIQSISKYISLQECVN